MRPPVVKATNVEKETVIPEAGRSEPKKEEELRAQRSERAPAELPMTDYRPSFLRKAARQEARNTVRFSDDTEEEDAPQNEPRWETEHSKSRGNPADKPMILEDIG
jgi:hypothetical protein